MNIRKLLLISAAILGFAGQAAAQVTDQVTVARVTGTVTATLPDGSSAAVKAGDKLSQGAKIVTGDKSEAYLVSHGDTTSMIAEKSEVEIAEISTTGAGGNVTKQTTTLDLKSGNIVAKLNPAKKSVNNYSVRTPKGVAAARGTTFSVRSFLGQMTVAVINGAVQLTGSFGTFSIVGGQVNSGGGTVSLAEYAKEPINQTFLTELVAAIAVAAENNIGGTSSTELKSVVDSVLQAAPALAPAIGSAVQQFAPSQSSVIQESTKTNAPGQSDAVKDSINNPIITTPQYIDPSTVSRSSE